jgi:Domain of unknown function (DUF4333)
MARSRSGFALVGALVLAAGLGACSTSSSRELNVGRAETKIRQLADRAYAAEAKVDNVRCPASVPIEKGLTFFCTVDIDGVPLRVKVRQKDSRSNVRIDQVESVIFTSKLERFVASYGAGHDLATSDVTCGKGSVLTGAPGKVLTCKVKFADGGPGVAKVVVRDTNGGVGLARLGPTS